VPIPHAQEVFHTLLESLKLSVSNRVETDANVTLDPTKILRMPDTIHGGSGLLAKTIPADLGSFEPMHQALAFSMDKKETVQATRHIPALSLGNQTFDAIENGKAIELPAAYAIYLVCKKVAVPV
jgi:DNA primase small subunit